jgi:hypothetical protein
MSNVTTANWDTGGEEWTLPIGAQFGRLVKIADKQPVNLQVGALLQRVAAKRYRCLAAAHAAHLHLLNADG